MIITPKHKTTNFVRTLKNILCSHNSIKSYFYMVYGNIIKTSQNTLDTSVLRQKVNHRKLKSLQSKAYVWFHNIKMSLLLFSSYFPMCRIK